MTIKKTKPKRTQDQRDRAAFFRYGRNHSATAPKELAACLKTDAQLRAIKSAHLDA